MIPTYFDYLNTGDLFLCNGNEYIKKSKRTGQLLENGRLFYFDKFDLVKQTRCIKTEQFRGDLMEYLEG